MARKNAFPTQKRYPQSVYVLVLLALLAGPLLGLSPVKAASVHTAPNAPFTVNSVGDGGDADPGDGFCETAIGNGVCTLRAAIQETNALTGPDTINFDPSVGLIAPGSPLPALNDATGGTTIKGNPNWILGSFAGTGANGFTLVSDGHTLQGLWITNFEGNGVWVEGSNHTIGTDGDGADDASEGNVISSNGGHGVYIQGATGIKVAGNLIGLTFDGTGDAGNGLNGVVIQSGAQTNRIGTDGNGTSDELERNVISGNEANGVLITGAGTEQNTVAGNYIGINITGDAAISNTLSGIHISTDSANNRIGTDGDGTSDDLERNVVSGNAYSGIELSHCSGNVLAGNYIGTNAAGDAAIPNGYADPFEDGVQLWGGAANNLIGTNGDGQGDAVEGNLISGNDGYGIFVGTNTEQNTIAGNYIGTNAAGDAAVPNAESGISLYNSNNNRVGTDGDGTSDELEGNVISGNGTQGIVVSGSGNIIAGNYIGTNAAGNAAVANNDQGVLVSGGGTNNLVGTDADGTSDELEGNVISGNSSTGIYITGDGADDNVVAGNYIGTNAAGDAAIPNGGSGLRINDADNTRIGGTTAAERNVISGNGDSGISIHSASTANLVQGNYIGTDASGSGALGNVNYGVYISTDSIGNTIGGTASGAANLIAFHGLAGIWVDGSCYDNSLRGNAVFSNTDLGIDLSPGGVTPNDPGDGDDGANHLQNFPELSSAASDGSQILIEGTLNSSANSTFELDFYANETCDPSGYGEGQVYLGADTVTTDGSGDASFAVTLPGNVPVGYYATATATDPDGNTSEFSECLAVTALCDPVHGADFGWDPPVPIAGQVVTFTGSASGTLPITFDWDFGDGSTGSGAVVQHSYAAAGDYTVVVTATNCTDSIAIQTHVITVQEPPCEPVQDAAFNWAPTTPAIGQVVTFNGSANGTAPISYTWDFGDATAGAGATVTHTYGLTGSYTVVMTATNCSGLARATVTHTLTVVEEPVCTQVQIVTVTADVLGCVVDFAAELYGDAPFSYLWAFGDGVTSTLTGPSHAYPASGTYTVTLEVWNCAEAGHAVQSFPLTVECAPSGYQIFLPLVSR